MSIEKGIKQNTRFVVENMLKRDMSMKDICEIAGCDEAYVEEVKQEMLVAATT